MITVSLCMIVKNEEAVLARCLDSMQGLVEEIIIVDTGSTDSTKEIAARYTDKVYDYVWQDDFASARNYAFSKAGMEYIYSADADEMLPEESRRKFQYLKETLLPEIEIVQMVYMTDMRFNTTENYVQDYRPKLFRRLRSFQWVDPIHEMVRLDPIVYNSDIEILHLPVNKHQKRDFGIFERVLKEKGTVSERLFKMYARELYLSGEMQDFMVAEKYFMTCYEEALIQEQEKSDLAHMAAAVLCKGALLTGNEKLLMKVALQDMVVGGSAEVCMMLGKYFFSCNEFQYALKWYRYAAFSTESYLDVHSSGDDALLALAETLEASDTLRDDAEIASYRDQAREWQAVNGFSADNGEETL